MKYSLTNQSRDQKESHPLSVGGKITLTLFFLFFFGMGLLFVVLMLKQGMANFRSRFWLPVTCSIVSSVVEDLDRDQEPYGFKVEYEYEWNGRRYKGRKIDPSTDAVYSNSYYKVFKLSQKYGVGQQVTGYINPENPQEVILTQGDWTPLLFIPIPFIFVFIGAGGIYAIWFFKRSSYRSRFQWRKHPYLARVGIFCLGILLLGVGVAVTYFFSWRTWNKYMTSRHWPQVECRILLGRVLSHDSDDTTTYSVDILYEYEFEGKTYRSNTYDLIGGSSSGYYGKQKIVDDYLQRRRSVCFVNPQDPAEAVLKKEVGFKILLTFFPVLFVLVGLGIVWKGVSPTSDSSNWELSSGENWRDERLKGSSIAVYVSSPWRKLVGILTVAVVWNGIVGVFVYQLIEGFRIGQKNWFLALSLLPFILIGIVIIAGVGSQCLALFNPRVKIVLSPGALSLGKDISLIWSLQGNSHRVRSLKISLKGIEQITVNDRKVEKPFYSQTLVDCEGDCGFQERKVVFSLPPHTMHSFDGKDHHVCWSLLVQGVVAGGPQIREEYTVQVLPTRGQ